ncbi:YlbF family regulator [Bacillus sp. FJAT-50079]|uniref:YlbF family regulator n=1 Tax=Bacillus sp. FJAT-50079 TaxID=2833577 RepID=UPI001BC9D9EA|nr:YlbF family regulator [Bacillus sp. FJAT-50079]MBS4210710.1 YlbF family regulator [Bacillus sp. FJAT-50079]
MSTNVYDYAYELEKALRTSEEYVGLKQMYDMVENDPEAKAMFDEFRQIQMQLQQKQMAGEDISEDEVKQAQLVANRVQTNELVTKLMDAEQRMSMAISELNKIIMKPLEELYGSMNGQ